MQLNPISNSNAHSYDVRNVLCALTRTSYVQHFHQMEKRVIIVNRIFFLPRVRSEIEKKHTHTHTTPTTPFVRIHMHTMAFAHERLTKQSCWPHYITLAKNHLWSLWSSILTYTHTSRSVIQFSVHAVLSLFFFSLSSFFAWNPFIVVTFDDPQKKHKTYIKTGF